MPPTFFESLIAGGAAGTAVDLLFFPIDTLKTRLQSAQGFARAGGFRGIYKGIGSVGVGSAPGAAAFFCTYDTLKKTLPFPDHLSPVNHVVSASLGEIAACLIRVPTEVIKTRMQTSSYGSGLSSFSAARILWTSEGLRGFYKGFSITVMREIPFTSIQFPLYEVLKSRLSHVLGRKPLYAYEAAICGSIAGGFAAAATTPLDVLKTRVMLDMRVCQNSFLEDPTSPSPTLISRFRMIYVEGGTKALFSGVVPRTMWISAGGAVFLGVYEWVAGGLMNSRHETK
ncbi:mitochondrial carrier domain-containing protein [Lentinula guzmanii]|uniref:Mitochondrial carrier domain-containing protein n=1 Tax=Lentinula guzmanii TaxID=2804957 RepID=A0AA38N3H0_9AGAR|nr:mitochondrial carrier domain-containing protein [Lentinula guzmanii]